MTGRTLRRNTLLLVTVGILAAPLVRISAHSTSAEQRPGTALEYQVEHVDDGGRSLAARFTTSQLAVLEKLNRADVAHLGLLEWLVVPSQWVNELHYSPFPLTYPAAVPSPKLVVVDLASQAFAAYERGHLVWWGPVSSGRKVSPTPGGLFHLNWRSRGRHSTVNPQWYMEWYFNFDNAGGLSLHSYALPGAPASHACIRLLERDAMWIYQWGEGWRLDAAGQVIEPGTPLLVIGQYASGDTPPWRSLAHLARGIDLPEHPLALAQSVHHFGDFASPRSTPTRDQLGDGAPTTPRRKKNVDGVAHPG